MEKLRILVVDANKIIRKGLTYTLEDANITDEIVEANNGMEAIRKVAEAEFDVILIDSCLEGMSSIQATTKILQMSEEVKVIGVSMKANLEQINGMLAAGASGYVFKDYALKELKDAILSVVGGKDYFSEGIVRAVV